MNVAEAEKVFAELVDRVSAEGVTIDLERDGQVVARLIPVVPRPPLKAKDLNAVLRQLPSLGDDAENFARDVREIRAGFPLEADPWEH